LAKSLLDTRSAEQIDKDKQEKEKNKIIDQGLIDTVQKKLNRPLFMANIRIVASAETLVRAEDIVDSLAAGFPNLCQLTAIVLKLPNGKVTKRL